MAVPKELIMELAQKYVTDKQDYAGTAGHVNSDIFSFQAVTIGFLNYQAALK